MAVKSISIRIEEEMLQKIAYVADYEGRSINSHILVLVRNSVKQFEEDNGKIELDQPIERDENVKPTAKNSKN